MTSSNGRAQIKRLPLDLLFVDQRYQRPLNEGRIAKIASEFEPVMCGALEVSARSNGQYALLDGQHRYGSLKLLDQKNWDCRIHEGLSVQDEAALFVRLQTERLSVAPIHRHKALLVMGDPTARRVESIVNEAGYRITVNKTYAALTCVIGLYQVYERYGPDVLRDALQFIDDVWTANDHFARKAPMIVGISLLLLRAGKLSNKRAMDIESLKVRLKGISGGSAKVMRDSHSQGGSQTTNAVRVALELQEIYNKGRTTGRVNIPFGRES